MAQISYFYCLFQNIYQAEIIKLIWLLLILYSTYQIYLLQVNYKLRDFPKPDLRPNIGPFPLKNEQTLPIIVYIIPNLFVLLSGENFIKMGTKLSKLQMLEILHKNVNENVFSFIFLYKFS